MIVIEDSITDDLYQKCVEELNKKISKNCWRSSSLNWSSKIKQGVIGSCVITPVSDKIQKLLDKELKSLLPKYTELILQYYIWQPQSGISWHNDKASDRSFGATLYLNEGWEPNSGGWFVWEDDDGYHTVLPKKKLLVVNDDTQCHCVTPVAPDTFRCTIQMWDKC